MALGQNTGLRILQDGDIVLLYSPEHHTYVAHGTTDLLRVDHPRGANPRYEMLTIGGRFYQKSERPGLSSAQTDALPMAVHRLAGPGPVATWDPVLLRALDSKLKNHSFLAADPLEGSDAINGVTYYGEQTHGSSAVEITWAFTGPQRGYPVQAHGTYPLVSLYAGNIGGAYLTVVPPDQAVQNTTLVTTSSILGQASRAHQWAFEWVARVDRTE